MTERHPAQAIIDLLKTTPDERLAQQAMLTSAPMPEQRRPSLEQRVAALEEIIDLMRAAFR